MSVEITPVHGRRELCHFIDLPWGLFSLHRKDAFAPVPDWTPPLRMMVRDTLNTRKNPFYRDADIQLFLATRDGRDVGRIAAIEVRAHNRFHEDRVGFFGFFESVDDATIALAGLPHHFDDSRARRELGYTPAPLREVIARAWAWFKEYGYA